MGNIAKNFQPVVVASHRRSGTHLTIDTLRRQFPACTTKKYFGAPMDRLYLNYDALCDVAHSNHVTDKGARVRVSKNKSVPIKTHKSYEEFRESRSVCVGFYDDWLADAVIFYIIRDVRRVLCSLHAYEQVFRHESRVPLREFLGQRNKAGQNRVEAWGAHVRSWIKVEDPRVSIVRYEDIVQSPKAVLDDFSNKLDCEPLMVDPLLPPPWRNRLQSLLVGRLHCSPVASTIIGRPASMVKPILWDNEFEQSESEMLLNSVSDIMDRFGYH